jgi:hypothetical protein
MKIRYQANNPDIAKSTMNAVNSDFAGYGKWGRGDKFATKDVGETSIS